MLYDDGGGTAEDDFAAYQEACEYAASPDAANLCGRGTGKIVLSSDQFDDDAASFARCVGMPSVRAACEYGIVESYIGVHHASAGSFESYESACTNLPGGFRTRSQKAESTARSLLQ